MILKTLKLVIICFRPEFTFVEVSGKTDFRTLLFAGTCCMLGLLNGVLS